MGYRCRYEGRRERVVRGDYRSGGQAFIIVAEMLTNTNLSITIVVGIGPCEHTYVCVLIAISPYAHILREILLASSTLLFIIIYSHPQRHNRPKEAIFHPGDEIPYFFRRSGHGAAPDKIRETTELKRDRADLMCADQT